jgi:hypothetical protein
MSQDHSPTIPMSRHLPRSVLQRVHVEVSDHDTLLCLALILVHLIPIWAFTYFPSQDGPAHLNNATIIREYHDRPVFREYYSLNKDLVPNWVGHLVLAGLMSLMPALVAEKMLLSGYVILLPISLCYVLRTIRPDGAFLTVLIFPFVYNFFLHMGFYNFSYSLVMFFVVVGYWLKHYEGFTRRDMMMLTILSLVLYFCHIVSLVTAYMAIGLLTMWFMGCALAHQLRTRQFTLRALSAALRARVLVPFSALLPTLILVAIFLLQHGTTRGPTPPVAHLWHQLYHLTSLISYDEREGWWSTVFVWLFIAVVGYLLVSKIAHRRGDRWDGLLLVVAGYSVVYFTAPDTMSGGGLINPRMNLYLFFALMLWCGAQSYHRMVKRGIQIVAVGIALTLLGLHVPRYVELNEYLEEYLSGTHLIEPNTTLLPLHFSPRGYSPDGHILSSRVAPFVNASGHIAAQQGIVDLQNYEAWGKAFPVMFRPHLHPIVHIWNGMQFQSPSIDFLSYPQRTGGRVDYILIWRTGEDSQDGPVPKFYRQVEPSISQQLEAGYERIYTSPQRGFLQLYRRKAWRP